MICYILIQMEIKNMRPSKRKNIGKEEEEEEEWRDWSSLSGDLLLIVLQHLTSLHDFSTFRRVCRHWKSTSASSPPDRRIMSSQSPLIVLSRHVGVLRTLTRTFYDVAQNRCYSANTTPPPGGHVIGYSHGHVITYAPGRHRGPSVALTDFFTGAETVLRGGAHRPHRLLLSAPPTSPDFLAVSLSTPSTIGYFHAGAWNVGSTSLGEVIVDILFFKNRLYALTEAMELSVLDHPLPKKMTALKPGAGKTAVEVPERGQTCRFLVESGGELLAIGIKYGTRNLRSRSKMKRCNIWRWGFESGGGWEVVTDLAGRAVFIGSAAGSTGSVSVSVPDRRSGSIRGNCIYYIDRKHCSWMVYSLEERAFSEIHPAVPAFNSTWAEPRETPVWIFPSLF